MKERNRKRIPTDITSPDDFTTSSYNTQELSSKTKELLLLAGQMLAPELPTEVLVESVPQEKTITS